jgi:hypothetical protein
MRPIRKCFSDNICLTVPISVDECLLSRAKHPSVYRIYLVLLMLADWLICDLGWNNNVSMEKLQSTFL